MESELSNPRENKRENIFLEVPIGDEGLGSGKNGIGLDLSLVLRPALSKDGFPSPSVQLALQLQGIGIGKLPENMYVSVCVKCGCACV